jgi:peptidoglycan/LPS O-acetylase OafA/YrhL
VVNFHFLNHLPLKGAWFLKQPVAILLITGGPMVQVFFVISGYVLSYRMVKLMRLKQALPLLDAIVSSVFRRYIRLYGSAAVASFLAMLSTMYRKRHTRKTPPVTQIMTWGKDFAAFSNVFAKVEGYQNDGTPEKYLMVLWTIPVEYRGSIILFFYCIAACKLSTINRMILCWFLMACSYYWNINFITLFLGGAFLADLSFTRNPERLGRPALPVATEEKSPQRQSRSKKIFYSAMLVCSLMIIGKPPGKLQDGYWPWPVLAKIAKPHWWVVVGALQMVWALDSYETLQIPLNWNFSQYLGDLSFGIYVMHPLVIWLLWDDFLNPWRLRWLGKELWTLIPTMALFYLVVLWAAEQFIKIDNKVVALGRWLQKKVFIW